MINDLQNKIEKNSVNVNDEINQLKCNNCDEYQNTINLLKTENKEIKNNHKKCSSDLSEKNILFEKINEQNIKLKNSFDKLVIDNEKINKL